MKKLLLTILVGLAMIAGAQAQPWNEPYEFIAVSNEQGGITLDSIQVEPQAMYAIVQGFVRDSDTLDGIEGVRVTCVNGVGVCESDSRGQYHINILAGTWTLRFTHSDYTTERITVTVQEFDNITRNVKMNCKDINFDGYCDYEVPPDQDADGVPDAIDNCISMPNGPLLGTCICSDPSRGGLPCYSNQDCSTCTVPGICTADQENYYIGACITGFCGDACTSACIGNFEACCQYYVP